MSQGGARHQRTYMTPQTHAPGLSIAFNPRTSPTPNHRPRRGRIYTPDELAEDMGPVFIDDGVEQNTGPMVRPMTAVQRGAGSR